MVSGELGVDSIMYFAIQMFSIAQITAVESGPTETVYVSKASLRTRRTNPASMDRMWDGTPRLKGPMVIGEILFKFPNLYVRLYWIRDIKDSIYSRSMQFTDSLIARISLPNMVN